MSADPAPPAPAPSAKAASTAAASTGAPGAATSSTATAPTRTRPPRWRATRVAGCLKAEAVHRPDGSWLLRSTEALTPFPARITDALAYYAQAKPEQVFVARRTPGTQPAEQRPWQSITYAQMFERVRRVGQALALRMADGEISPERPIAILSGNDLQHLTLALAACWVGVPYAPVSPAYSTLAQDPARLRHILTTLTPGLVFASTWGPYARAIEATVPTGVELVLTDAGGLPSRRAATRFAQLLEPAPGAAVELAHGRVGPETVAKFLFTSGSTKQPKGVVTTNRMWCANLQQIRQCFAFFADEPPVLVDWLPWNHVFGGNHNVGIALYNGGTLYIDDGRPTAAGMAETIANLREIAPTVYFNVPKGFEELAAAMEHDEALRRNLFKRVRAFMFAGAGLSQAVWDHLDRLAERTVGERIPIFTGLGMTETSPSCTFALGTQNRAGDIGLPVPGVDVKVAPVEGKLEVRFRGPNVMSEYWRAIEERLGSVRQRGFTTAPATRCRALPQAGHGDEPPDPTQARLRRPHRRGLQALNRHLRQRGAAAHARHPFRAPAGTEDVVVAGPNRDEIGFLVFPRIDDARFALAGADRGEPMKMTLAHPKVRGFFRNWLKALWDAGTGNSNRPTRALLLVEPPSLDRGEVTDKGLDQPARGAGRARRGRGAAVRRLAGRNGDPHHRRQRGERDGAVSLSRRAGCHLLRCHLLRCHASDVSPR
ncbi:MAG: feruloyl-CoA synthase [Rubrivivax sp.]